MKSYEDMLKEAIEKIPPSVKKESRLEVPKPQVIYQGNRTFLLNFSDICDSLRRDPKHLAKFLFRELAKPGNIDGNRLVFQGKVERGLLEKKIENYIKEFVYCKECKRPDTQLIKEDRIIFMKCEACGAKQPVRKI